MTYRPLAKGDRVDYREHRNGEVLRVGRATLWAVFQTPYGAFPVAAPIADFKRHEEGAAIRIGEFVVRSPGVTTARVQISSAVTGEMMETETAKFESWIAKFWNKEF